MMLATGKQLEVTLNKKNPDSSGKCCNLLEWYESHQCALKHLSEVIAQLYSSANAKDLCLTRRQIKFPKWAKWPTAAKSAE